MLTCPHCKKEFEPLELDGAKIRRRTKLTFAAWLKSLNGAEAIPHGHHSLVYAEQAGIPSDLVALAWEAFCRNYRASQKLYADWPAVFRKALEGNWFRLWFVDQSGTYGMTTQAHQLRKTLNVRGAA
jgi:hypothetical protein